jgi:hypothetical protein
MPGANGLDQTSRLPLLYDLDAFGFYIPTSGDIYDPLLEARCHITAACCRMCPALQLLFHYNVFSPAQETLAHGICKLQNVNNVRPTSLLCQDNYRAIPSQESLVQAFHEII